MFRFFEIHYWCGTEYSLLFLQDLYPLVQRLVESGSIRCDDVDCEISVIEVG